MNKEKQRQRLRRSLYRHRRKNAYSTLITFSFFSISLQQNRRKTFLMCPFPLSHHSMFRKHPRRILIFYDNFLLIPNDIFAARFFLFLIRFLLPFQSIWFLMFLCHVNLLHANFVFFFSLVWFKRSSFFWFICHLHLKIISKLAHL